MQPGKLSQQPSCQYIPPTLDLTSRHLSNKTKLKIITNSTMNDTFANWRKKKKSKKESMRDRPPQLSESDLALPTEPAVTHSFRGLTLEQYFKGRSLSDNKTMDQNSTTLDTSAVECEETQQYLQEPFQIHETDEDNYNESQKSVRTPEFTQHNPTTLQKKILKKYTKKHSSKLRTEVCQEHELAEATSTRSRFPTMMAEERESSSVEKVDRHQLRKMRAISNLQKPIDNTATFTDFFKYEGQAKKHKILQKVKQQKDRLQDMRSNDFGFVTKYAEKFGLGEKMCRQIIKECRN